MAKKAANPITQVSGTNPSFLTNFIEEDNSLDTMQEYRVLPRVKVIQALTAEDLKAATGPEGTVIVRPGDAIIQEKGGEPFLFVPLFFFVEFIKWADRKDKESSMIVERSYDPLSEVGKKCQDSNQWVEPYGPENKWNYRNAEHLNFPGIIYGDHPLAGQQVVQSFSRGEYGRGKSFISTIQMRKMKTDNGPRTIPLWAQVYSATSNLRDKNTNKWWGLDLTPAENPVIDPNDAEEFRAMHLELKELHEKNILRVDHTDPDADEAESAEDNKNF